MDRCSKDGRSVWTNSIAHMRDAVLGRRAAVVVDRGNRLGGVRRPCVFSTDRFLEGDNAG